MKKNFLTRVAIAVVILSGLSCKKDLLNQPPYGVQTDVSYFKTSDDLNKTLTAAYSYLNLQGFPPFEATLWAIGDVGADDAFKGGGPVSNTPAIYDLAFGQQKPTSNIVSIFWSQSYNIIAACNLVIDKQSVVTGDANEIKKMVNQAKFLRAYCYYNFTNFGDLPMPLAYLDPAKVDLPRTPKATVWAQIEKDLTDASALPTKTQWGIANEGRATSGAALALLGKAYMFQKKYTDAEVALKKVIDEGTYSLAPDYGSIFRKASGDNNSPESIFDIKHKTRQGGLTDGEGNFNFTFVMPSDGAVGGFGYLEPSQDLVNEFEKGDPRAIYSIMFRGDVFPTATSTYTVNNTTSASGRANRKSFITPLERSAISIFDEGKSNHLIRYSEVLLLHAEALNENGKATEALTWLNKYFGC